MRIAAFILGILGGLIGLGWAIITLAVKISETISSLAEYGYGAYDFVFVWMYLAVALLSMVGLIGGALALTAPKPAGVLMLIPAGVFIAEGVLCFRVGMLIPLLVGGILVLVAGILACVSQRRSAGQS